MSHALDTVKLVEELVKINPTISTYDSFIMYWQDLKRLKRTLHHQEDVYQIARKIKEKIKKWSKSTSQVSWQRLWCEAGGAKAIIPAPAIVAVVPSAIVDEGSAVLCIEGGNKPLVHPVELSWRVVNCCTHMSDSILCLASPGEEWPMLPTWATTCKQVPQHIDQQWRHVHLPEKHIAPPAEDDFQILATSSVPPALVEFLQDCRSRPAIEAWGMFDRAYCGTHGVRRWIQCEGVDIAAADGPGRALLRGFKDQGWGPLFPEFPPNLRGFRVLDFFDYAEKMPWGFRARSDKETGWFVPELWEQHNRGRTTVTTGL